MGDRKPRRIVILAAGRLDAFTAKTAAGVIRYRGDEVVAVLAPEHAGGDLEALLGVGSGIPIIASLTEIDDLRPDTLLIGVATPGGTLPDAWRGILAEALERKMTVLNGLHTMLADDADLAALARRHGAKILDVRRPPDDLSVGMGRAADIETHVVLTVGSDCNVGKKITAIEITRELRSRNHDAVFVPTGQTGIMIEGRGIAVDRVIGDFISGAAERLVLEHKEHDWIIVEGQGAIFHPAYSGVTLGLMHGACPSAMVLCHQPTRRCLRHTDLAMPSLPHLVAMHEALMAPLRDSSVVGASLNCLGLDDAAAAAAVNEAHEALQLPATDVVRFGAASLVDALLGDRQTPCA